MNKMKKTFNYKNNKLIMNLTKDSPSIVSAVMSMLSKISNILKIFKIE